MTAIRIETEGTALDVTSPYNTDFVGRARRLAGRWNATRRVWRFDARDEQAVRDLLVACYGTDGTTMPDVVSVRLTYDGWWSAAREPFDYAGRIVAAASGRDSGARLGQGVVLLNGGFTSGGSRANWTTETLKSGAVVLLHDIPRRYVETSTVNYDCCTTEIVDTSKSEPDLAGLAAERARLTARLASIEASPGRQGPNETSTPVTTVAS